LKIFLYPGNGFALDKETDVSGVVNQLSTSDLNNDGGKEIILAKDDAVSVAKDDPAFGLTLQDQVASEYNMILTTGDINSDGFDDSAVVSIENNSETIKVLVNDAYGELSESIDIATPFTPADIKLSDIDSDWDLDIVLKSENGATFIYDNDGMGNFSAM
jgi:hypothetical protein